MPFIEGLKIYYTNVLDATIFVGCLFFVAGLLLLVLPKKFAKRDIPRLIIIGVACYAISIVVPSLFFALSNCLPGDMSFKTILFTMSMPLMVLVFGLIFLKGKFIHRFIKIIILFSTVLVVDALSKNLGFFIGQLVESTSILIYFARMLPYALFTGMCFLLYKIDIVRYGRLSKEMVIILTSLSIILFGIATYEHFSSLKDTIVNSIIAFLDFTLLILLALSYYATYKNIENRHRLTNLEVQKTLAEAEIDSIGVDKANREELEKLRHDIKNHFFYLDTLLKKKKYKEANKYIDEYLSKSDEVLNSFSCSNQKINAIINLELTKAKVKGIKMDVKAVVPPMLPFQDSDLVSLITNMIDNALENYDDPTGETKIVVRMYKQNDYIRFFVSNPINKDDTNDKLLLTTRKAGRGHGYGTKIIKNIVKEYSGVVDFTIEDNLFIADALLNMNIKEEESNA